MNHLDPKIRVPIELDNPSIERHEEKCIKCGNCARVCSEYLSVLDHYDLNKTECAVCVNCGQCANVCPTNCITEKTEYNEVKNAILDKDKIVIVSTSPSCRVSLGEEFGMPYGSFIQGKMVALLRKLGFKYVLDTNFSADLTIMEEATELINRIVNKDKPLPQFTSCCPAWVKFAEIFYPEIKDHISSCKSPIGMQGPIIKTYFANKMNIDPTKIVNVALTPCTAKKMEIRREEMYDAGKRLNNPDMRDMDYVITVRELAQWAREENIDFNTLADDCFDKFLGEASGAGVIFGNTGGVMEAALRTTYKLITKQDAPEHFYDLTEVRGYDGLKTAELNINDIQLKIAVVYGLKNAREIIDRVKNGEHFDFIEIMTCPGGCIGGGGQPKQLFNADKANQERIASLYTRDKEMKLKSSIDNSEIQTLYKEFLTEPCSKLAEELLHTEYYDKSEILKEGVKTMKMIKYKCLICGEVFELPEGQEPVCPKCLQKGEAIVKIDERIVATN